MSGRPTVDPALLDLFGGQQGAGVGYQRAGFRVYSVDNVASRAKYAPLPMHIGDVIEVMATLLAGGAIDFRHPGGRIEWMTLADFAAAHASPTCTGYSQGTVALPDRLTRYDRLIPITRELLIATGLPWVIENVESGATRRELRDPMRLCGFEFGLTAIDDDGTVLHLKRHRLFESNIFLAGAGGCPGHPKKGGPQVAGAYGGARRDKTEARLIRKGGYVPKSLAVLRALLGTPWMDEAGCFLSIPPAYAEHIGRQLIDHLASERAA